MAFRADEESQSGFERAYRYLLPQGSNNQQRARVREFLESIVEEYGPVIEGYPGWHPFMLETDSTNWAPMGPENTESFKHIDHTIYFANAMITCPYPHAANELIQSVNDVKHSAAFIRASKLENIVLYSEQAVPILISCDWYTELESDGTYPSRMAIGLMLEREVPNWRTADYCESWEDMRGQLLGYPHGARSSLFINQQTGQVMKNCWNQLIKTGVLGKPRAR